MSDFLRTKAVSLPMKVLCIASLIASALFWALSNRQLADDASTKVAPWQTALMQVQEHLQIEREKMQALSQTVLELQTTIQDIHARLDVQQAEQSALRQALQTAQQWAQSAQATAEAGQERLSTLHAKLALLEPRIPSSKAAPVATKPIARPALNTAPLIPPFRVLDVDYRGGTRFLAIAPKDSRRLTDIRLLREGDSVSGWQLLALSAQRAVFAVGSRRHTVALQPALSMN